MSFDQEDNKIKEESFSDEEIAFNIGEVQNQNDYHQYHLPLNGNLNPSMGFGETPLNFGNNDPHFFPPSEPNTFNNLPDMTPIQRHNTLPPENIIPLAKTLHFGYTNCLEKENAEMFFIENLGNNSNQPFSEPDLISQSKVGYGNKWNDLNRIFIE